MLCAPTAVTWREQRIHELITHTYAEPGPHIARFHWGDATVSTGTGADTSVEEAPRPRPELPLFAVQPAQEQALQTVIRLQVNGLAPGQQLRIDAGAGKVYRLTDADGPDQTAEWIVEYDKPGTYTVAVDLLDEDGFWLATLAETPLEVAFPLEEQTRFEEPVEDIPLILFTAPPEVPQVEAPEKPWLPFRYARPVWSGARTYTTPGGDRISRTLGPGTYLAIKAETVVNGALWYQTGGRDWIAASAVTLLHPSELRGVELGQPPEPPPEPEPTPTRRGIVTASLLNVRARPGVRPDNPPVDRLRYGTEVNIYEEETYEGAVWYRIGTDRWVHSGWVRLLEEPQPSPEPEEPSRRGIVIASVLNVRARPGVRPDNPPVDRLRYGTEVNIYEEETYEGAVWYRIGTDRWVHSGWVRLLERSARFTVTSPMLTATAEPLTLPVGWVVTRSLNVRSRPGVAPDNPPVDEVYHNQMLRILETRQVGGINWYRIGEDRWVYGRSVAVARFKPRPSSIGPSERWVGVCLKEQTAVAYEGDRPVYAAMVATGLPGTPTVQGIFRTWWRVPSRRMVGPGYYLEEVTWTCYFYAGYALHAAYWHDAFGRPRSHGCVNMSPYDAWWVFRWSEPDGPHSPMVYVYWM